MELKDGYSRPAGERLSAEDRWLFGDVLEAVEKILDEHAPTLYDEDVKALRERTERLHGLLQEG